VLAELEADVQILAVLGVLVVGDVEEVEADRPRRPGSCSVTAIRGSFVPTPGWRTLIFTASRGDHHQARDDLKDAMRERREFCVLDRVQVEAVEEIGQDSRRLRQVNIEVRLCGREETKCFRSRVNEIERRDIDS